MNSIKFYLSCANILNSCSKTILAFGVFFVNFSMRINRLSHRFVNQASKEYNAQS